MAIPFRDHTDVDDLGLAGYLRFIESPDGQSMFGVLFLINARADPVDFCFSRIDLVGGVLWRAGEARRQAVRMLALALFRACPVQPALLLALAEEAPAPVFSEDLEVHAPIARVSRGVGGVYAAHDAPEQVGEEMHAFWSRGAPPPDSTPRRLLDALTARGLALEPFERAQAGLDEALVG